MELRSKMHGCTRSACDVAAQGLHITARDQCRLWLMGTKMKSFSIQGRSPYNSLHQFIHSSVGLFARLLKAQPRCFSLELSMLYTTRAWFTHNQSEVGREAKKVIDRVIKGGFLFIYLIFIYLLYLFIII